MSSRKGSALSLAAELADVTKRLLELAQSLEASSTNARAGRLPERQLAREIDCIIDDAWRIASTARGLLSIESPAPPGSVEELENLITEVANSEGAAYTQALLERTLRLTTTGGTDDQILAPVRARATQLLAHLATGKMLQDQALDPLSLLMRGITHNGDERAEVAIEVTVAWGKDLGHAVRRGELVDGANNKPGEMRQTATVPLQEDGLQRADHVPGSTSSREGPPAHRPRAKPPSAKSSRAPVPEPATLKHWPSGSLLLPDTDENSLENAARDISPHVRAPSLHAVPIGGHTRDAQEPEPDMNEAPEAPATPEATSLPEPDMNEAPETPATPEATSLPDPPSELPQGEDPLRAPSRSASHANETPPKRGEFTPSRAGTTLTASNPSSSDPGASSPVHATVPHAPASSKVGISIPTEKRAKRASAAEDARTVAVDYSPIWRLLRARDEAGAYWYARCAELVGAQPPVPSKLLAVLQASRWLDRIPNALVGDVAYIAETFDTTADPHATMLATAAALVPTLTHPFTKLRGRLQRGLDEALDPVIVAVEEFANFNQPLTQELLTDFGLLADQTRQVEDACARLQRWMVDGPRKTINFQAATRVWQDLFRLTFMPILEGIRDEAPSALHDAIALATKLRSTKHVQSLIADADKRLRRSTAAPIIGSAMARLEREIAETASLIEEWIVVAQKADLSRKMDWLTERADELRRALAMALPDAVKRIDDMQSGQNEAQAACAVVLRLSLDHLALLLRLPSVEHRSAVPDGIELLVQGVDGLSPALETRLLWTPTFYGAREPKTAEHAQALLSQLASAVPIATQAFELWITHACFDEVFRLEPLVRAEDLEHAQAELEAARVKLDRRVTELRSLTELGVVDGYVGDERAELLGMLDKLQPRETQNIAEALRVGDDIQTTLNRLRSARLEEAWGAWTALYAQLTKKFDAAVLAPWQERFEADRARGDVRVLDERLAELRDGVGKGKDLSVELESGAARHLALRQFQDLMGRLERERVRLPWAEVREKFRRGSPPAPGLEPVPTEHRKQIANVADKWLYLQQKGPKQSDSELITAISTVLRQVGFEPLGTDPFKVVQRHGTAVMLTASLSDGGHSPIPDFGSAARNHYGIACVWSSTNIEAIARLIQNTPELPTPMLVLYGGSLSGTQRTQLRHVSRHTNVKMLCLDELLLLFLLVDPESSLEKFFACTLPYVLINPYTPFQAGEVAPEMYFGRKQLVQELLRPDGSCIVYGGRQLGKSALLREVRRRFHRPEKQQHAIVLDILTVGDPKAGVETSRIWQQLRDRLRDSTNGIGFETKRSNADELATALREHLDKHPQMRLTVLLDEADNFLDADAKDGFKVVNAFRTLMGETHRRFRVVFTGLHNVQRFQQLPNQPLAHFGAAIQVGPLEPRDAANLIRRPLEALGFEFAEQDDVLRILSYTNYHPGLIQLFCHNLLLQLQQTALQPPPVKVMRQHIDKVYENPTVRDEIVKRFEWTLALDQRYQAVAWSLIVDQGDARLSNPARTTSELFALVKEWWPRGFASTEFEEFRGLLDEMVGLGVLTASAAGFRLRSPNVIQLMGDVDQRLHELMDKDPPAVFDVDRLHRLAKDDLYSPLTLGQERQLFARRWGVGLVFTSRALDGDGFIPSIKALHDEGRFSLWEAPGSLAPGDLAEWVSSVADKAAEALLVIIVRASTDCLRTAALIEAARTTCARRSTGQKLAGRLVFAFDPAATTAWVRSKVSGPAERQVDVVLWPHKWTLQGLRARLHQRELPDDEAHVQPLHDITGGWGLLVDRAFRGETGGRGKREQHTKRLEELARCLAIPGDPNREDFLRSLGITEGTREAQLLQLIHTLVGIEATSRDHLTVDVFESEMPDLTADDLECLLQVLTRLGILEHQAGNDGRDTVRIDPVVARLLITR